ncbi:monovalent cation/H+ antiporter complex subunit F [Deinococcus sonorensis]|uniref:Monovalent cation/H+ antiporter complex subunit F n=2 Tax=Deinococcus sonorensis TaxID=309891 RepID=A0AAU7U4W6_9DEIO
MNVWLIAATVMLLALLPCGVVCVRGNAVQRLVGLELAGLLTALTMVLLAEVFDRDLYFDLALACALMSFGGGLVFTRFLERWL